MWIQAKQMYYNTPQPNIEKINGNKIQRNRGTLKNMIASDDKGILE